MSYRWVDHTAELELSIEASTAEGVFADALHALAELLADDASGAPAWRREIRLEGPDLAALLVAWLDELVYLAETEDLVPEELGEIELTDTEVRADVGFRHTAPRHLVKGATYHRLAFEPAPRGMRATVVLDV